MPLESVSVKLPTAANSFSRKEERDEQNERRKIFCDSYDAPTDNVSGVCIARLESETRQTLPLTFYAWLAPPRCVSYLACS